MCIFFHVFFRFVSSTPTPHHRKRLYCRRSGIQSAGGSHSADGSDAADATTATALSEGQRTDSGDGDAGGGFDNSGVTAFIDYMTSDNDGESVSTSRSVRPSPMPAACRPEAGNGTAAKGILVHCNNKKSANTNRVSFDVTSSSSASAASTPSSTPSPPVYRARKDGDRSRRRQPDDGQRTTSLPPPAQKPVDLLSPLPKRPPPPAYSARDGRRITGFGVKSYLHEFYDDPAEDHFQSFQDDDFKYFVEPEIRWHGHCSGVYAVLGLTAVTIGAAMMAVSHLIPARDTVVVQSADTEVVDRWAVSFNENLVLSRYVGSVVFAVGVVFTVVRFWISVIRNHGSEDELLLVTENKLADSDKLTPPRKLPLSTELQRDLRTVRIPITGSVENVQPEPGAIRLQFSDTS